MGDQPGDEEQEVPVAALLDALDLPPAVVARWMDHLDAFFARHGGARRYAALARLTAETRAAASAQEQPAEPGTPHPFALAPRSGKRDRVRGPR